MKNETENEKEIEAHIIEDKKKTVNNIEESEYLEFQPEVIQISEKQKNQRKELMKMLK